MSKTKSKTKAPTVVVTVATFDDAVHRPPFRVISSAPIAKFRSITTEDYSPNGMTPLRDATMRMIRHLNGQRTDDTIQIGLLLDESGSMRPNTYSVIAGVNEFVSSMQDVPPKEGGRVMCIVFTDGKENASVETSPADLASTVRECENNNWTFIYMGANMDAWTEGSMHVGISGGVRGQSVNFTSSPIGTQSAFAEAGRRTSNYLAGQGAYDVYAMEAGNNSVIPEDDKDAAS